VGALDELGRLDPGVDLIGFGVVGQFRHGRTHHRHELGGGVEAGEGLVDELVDDPSAFVVRQPGQSVHQFHLLWVGPVLGHGSQDGPADPQGADPHVQRLRVHRGDLGNGDPAVRHPPDGRQVESEFAQCPYEVQARQGVQVVEQVLAFHAPHLRVSRHWRLKPFSGERRNRAA